MQLHILQYKIDMYNIQSVWMRSGEEKLAVKCIAGAESKIAKSHKMES